MVMRLNGDDKGEEYCQFPNCDEEMYACGYCKKHHSWMKRRERKLKKMPPKELIKRVERSDEVQPYYDC